jgi:hypothetical protein
MNNATVEFQLDNCASELQDIASEIATLGVTSPISPYLTRYALIRACGTIEVAFKALIADYCSYRSKAQVKRFIQRRIRDGSANPSYDNIVKFLKDFDEGWRDSFKATMSGDPRKTALLASLGTLVDARNEFAHGGTPSVSIRDVVAHFNNSRAIIEMLDGVIC